MPHVSSSAWLELAVLGLATALIVNRRLAAEGPAHCASALAGPNERAPASAARAEILRATWIASDSGWARLVRAALRDGSPVLNAGAGGYRDAPPQMATEAVVQLASEERSRIGRGRATGLVASAATAIGSAMLIPAQAGLMCVFALAALIAAWRVSVNGTRALRALDEARRALPPIVALLPPPPPPVVLAIEPAPARVPLSASAGILGGIFVLGFGLIFVIIGGGVLAATVYPVPDEEIALIFGVHILLLPVLAVLVVLLPKRYVTLDIARGEVVVVHRFLGFAYDRTVASLEIVGRFFVASDRIGRTTSHYLAIDTVHGKRRRGASPTPEPRVLLAEGGIERVTEAALRLNRALGLAESA